MSENSEELVKLARSQNLSGRMFDALIEDHIACISREQTCELCEENEEEMGREGEIANLLLGNPTLSAAQQKLVLDGYMHGGWDQDDVASLLQWYAGNTNLSDYGKERVLTSVFFEHWTWDDEMKWAIDHLLETIAQNPRFTKDEIRSLTLSLKD